MRLRFWLVFLALTAGCASRPLVENVDAAGRSVVLLLDASASMADTDPGHAAVQGASLTVALLGRHDNVGVIAYNARARVVVPLRPSGLAPSREEIRAALEQVGTAGSTDFGAALDAAEAMLDAAHAPAGSCAILLTDGLPTGRSSGLGEFGRQARVNFAIPDAVSRLAARGWRIFAIVVGPEAPDARGYLANLAGPTGGLVIEAKDASGLLDAFEAVSVQALGYLSARRLRGDKESVNVPPGTHRLALLANFAGSGDVGAIARDGKDVPEDEVIRFPRNAPFAVALLDEPQAGHYEVDAKGAASGLTLLEPGWLLELDPQAPPAAVEGGSKVPVSVRVRGEETSLARVREGMRLELEIEKAEKVLARVPLTRSAGPELRFEGAFLAPPEEEPITVTAIATVSEGGKTFEQRRSVAISVKKGTRAATSEPHLGVGAASFKGFEGEELRASVVLEGDPETAFVVTVEPPRGFTASPTRVELAAKGRATIEVRAAKDAASGALSLKVAPATAGLAAFRREAPLTVVRGSVPAELDFGLVRQGEKGKLEIGARNVDLSAAAPLAVEGSSLVLDAQQGGAFEGTATARCGASTRTIKVRARVSTPAPDKLTLRASFGWTSTVLELGENARIELEPLIHTGTRAHIEPDYDMRVTALGGGRYELKVLAPTSLPEGRYTGTVTTIVGSERKVIPLTFEVKR